MKMHLTPGTLTIIGLLTCSVSGQPYSIFQLENYGPDINAPISDSEGRPLRGSGYLVELWGSAAPDSLVPAVDLDNGLTRLFVPVGIYEGFEGYFFSSASLEVPSLSPGGSSWLQVRAWDARLGSTYEAVAALELGGYGESSVFYADGGNPSAINPEIPGRLLGLESFSLRPVVPEPSTWALVAMGGIAFWWKARRKRGDLDRRRDELDCKEASESGLHHE